MKLWGTQAYRQQNDLISLIIKIMGVTQTDGQMQTRIQRQKRKHRQQGDIEAYFYFSKKESSPIN
jgi:hypothetical protein